MVETRYGGWQIVAEHLSNQQRLQIKADHAAQHGDHTETTHTLDDGWSVKKLKRKSDFSLEGQLMQNCVGGYGPERGYHDVYSLRDPDDLPFVTFQMRRQGTGEGNGYWNHGNTNNTESTNEHDTGTEVLNTSSVLGRNNENPKEDYGKHLVSALSQIAKNEGIPKVRWDKGPEHTPEHLDKFLEEDKNPPPDNVYLKVPVGMKTEENGVDFTGGGSNRSHGNIKVSADEPEAQFGYHVFKTPFSEKRFDKEDDLGTRLNNPEDVTGGYRVKTKPNSYDPNVEGLKPTQVSLIHEAQTPDHVYMKMQPGDYEKAKNACGTCGVSGRRDPNRGYGPDCETCEGTGRGDKFSLRGMRSFRYGGLEASGNVPAATDEPDYDNLTIKVPFSEKNFSFNASTGGYSAKPSDWTDIDASQVELHKKRDLPEKLYIGVPSTDRQNKNVYSEEGVQPVFLRNQSMTLDPRREHFVGAKGNDLIEVDTSKLPDNALLNHKQSTGQGQRRDPWGARQTHMWEMNPRVAIPYEAITKQATTHEVGGPELKTHLRDEHGDIPAGRAPDRLTQHEQSHANGLGLPHDHPPLGAAINVHDPSEQNKRKAFVSPEPTALHDPTLTVRHPAPAPVESVQFETRLHGKTVAAIKQFEAGNISAEMGTGVPSMEGGISYGNDVKVHVKNDPEHVEEITPTIQQIREGGGKVTLPSGMKTSYNYESQPAPEDRYFQLKHDLPAGHESVKSFERPEGQREGSIIPDTAYVHVPRRRRGDTDLYGEKGIDLQHVLEPGSSNRSMEDLKSAWDKPHEGGREALQSSEDPNEMDVWAVDPHKMPNARVELGRDPYSYSSRQQGAKHTALTFPEGTSDESPDAHVVPWDAVKNLHRKPEEPTAPAIRRFFNTASVKAYKNIFLVR